MHMQCTVLHGFSRNQIWPAVYLSGFLQRRNTFEVFGVEVESSCVAQHISAKSFESHCCHTFLVYPYKAPWALCPSLAASTHQCTHLHTSGRSRHPPESCTFATHPPAAVKTSHTQVLLIIPACMQVELQTDISVTSERHRRGFCNVSCCTRSGCRRCVHVYKAIDSYSNRHIAGDSDRQRSRSYLIFLTLLPGCFGHLDVNLVLQERDVLLVVLQPALSLSNLHENTKLTISSPRKSRYGSQ